MKTTKSILDYYIFNFSTKHRIKKNLKGYNLTFDPNIGANYKSMYAFYGYILLNEVIQYYNGDLSLCASICNAIPLNNKTEKKCSFHMENFYFRLISCWDYIFIALNEFLHTELVASWDIKEKIIGENCYHSFPIQSPEGYIKIVKIPFSEEEKTEKTKKLRKELMVLSPGNLHKEIEKKYELTDHINKIFDLYNSDEVNQAKMIRNNITHSDSLRKDSSFSVSDIFKSQVISTKEQSDIIKLVEPIKPNMILLKNAITLLNEMITSDLFPNRIENKSKEYAIQKIKCKDCGDVHIYPSDFIDKLNNSLNCDKCYSENTVVIDKSKVSEPYYEQILIAFIEDTKKYLEADNMQ